MRNEKQEGTFSNVKIVRKKKNEFDYERYTKKDVYPPYLGQPCLDGGQCEFKVIEFGMICRHGDCTWYCPLKLQREKEHKEFQELFDWMEKRK